MYKYMNLLVFKPNMFRHDQFLVGTIGTHHQSLEELPNFIPTRGVLLWFTMCDNMCIPSFSQKILIPDCFPFVSVVSHNSMGDG